MSFSRLSTRVLVRSLCVPTAAAFGIVPGLDTYQALLATHPLQTNLATAGALALTGDSIAQGLSGAQYDAKRAASFVAFDAAYRGGFQTAALPWIIANCDGTVLRAITPAGVDLSLLAACEATVFNQFLVIPIIYYPLFFAVTGAVQGLDRNASLRRARTSFASLTIRNWKFWVPANLAQFVLLEPQYQVAYTCVMGLIWNIILSATAGDARAKPGGRELTEALDEADKLGVDALARRTAAEMADEAGAAAASPPNSPSPRSRLRKKVER